MATKITGRSSKTTQPGSFNGVVGYVRLPSRTRSGSHADWNKSTTKEVRASMAAIIGKYNKLIQGIKQVTPTALEYALEPAFNLSMEYCPQDTGALVESANLYAEQTDKGPRAWITYGGKGVLHYAAIVHERTDLRHAPPTRSKYLQAALEETVQLIKPRIRTKLKEIL